MTYKEWVNANNNTPYYQQITQDYPTTTSYLLLKFSSYQLRYEPDRFGELFQCFFLDYENQLKAIEAIKNINNNLQLEDFNTKRITKTTSNQDHTQKYGGFNVEGDFNKNETSNKNQVEGIAINVYGTIKSILNTNLAPTFNNIINKFKEFFVLFIAVDI